MPLAVRFLAHAALLSAIFAHNPGWVPDGVFTNRDGFRTAYAGYDSDLVLNRVALARDGCHPLHPLYWHDHQITGEGHPYTSQFGLQGVALGAAYRIVGGDVEAFVAGAATACAGLTALALAAFFASVAVRVGPAAADVGVLLAATSPVLLPFAASVYWVPFLALGPFLAAWLFYPRCVGSRRLTAGLFALVGGLVFVKCLCGYEYVTTVVAAPVAAVVYAHAARGDRFRAWVLPSVAVVLAGLVGFAAALGAHFAQLSAVLGEDGVAVVGGRAAGVTVGLGVDPGVTHGCLAPDPTWLPERVRLPARCVLNYHWLPAAATPATWGPARGRLTFGAVLLLSGAGFVAAWARRRRLPPAVAALAPAALAGWLAGASWHLLAVTHTCIHFHLNLVTYFVPFVLIAYSLIGWAWQRLTDPRPWARSALWLAVGAALALNLAVGHGPVRKQSSDSEAQERVADVLAGKSAAGPVPVNVLNPPVRLGFAPRDLGSDLWPACRVRPDANGTDTPVTLFTGIVLAGPAADGRPTARVVAVAGGRVVAAAAEHHRHDLVERQTRGKRTCTVFAVVVPDAAVPPGERVRLFAVTSEGASELPRP